MNFLAFAYEWYHMIFIIFVWLTSVTMRISWSILVAANGSISLIFMAE